MKYRILYHLWLVIATLIYNVYFHYYAIMHFVVFLQFFPPTQLWCHFISVIQFSHASACHLDLFLFLCGLWNLMLFFFFFKKNKPANTCINMYLSSFCVSIICAYKCSKTVKQKYTPHVIQISDSQICAVCILLCDMHTETHTHAKRLF